MTSLPWHDDDEFWRDMAPFMFTEDSWENATVQVEQLIALLQIAPGASVLDCACGPGRHTLELARRGYQVTGIDRTKGYLEEALRRAKAANLAPELLLDDMRHFRRPDTFDAVLSLFTSFGYFKDAAENEAVLLNLYQSLKTGGSLLMEISGKEVIARIYQRRDWREIDGAYFLEERDVAINWSRMESRWILVKDGAVKERRFDHWLYSAAELEKMLMGAGFGRIEFYGDLEGAPYDNEAKRLVAVACK